MARSFASSPCPPPRTTGEDGTSPAQHAPETTFTHTVFGAIARTQCQKRLSVQSYRENTMPKAIECSELSREHNAIEPCKQSPEAHADAEHVGPGLGPRGTRASRPSASTASLAWAVFLNCCEVAKLLGNVEGSRLRSGPTAPCSPCSAGVPKGPLPLVFHGQGLYPAVIESRCAIVCPCV